MTTASPPSVHRSLILLALGCVLPIAAMAAFLIFSYYEREQTQLSGNAIARARSMASSLDKGFASAEAALKALVTSPYLGKDDLRGFHAQALEAVGSIGAEQILLFDAKRTMLLTTLRQFGEPLPESPTPPELKRLFDAGKPGVTDLFTGRVVKRPVFVVTVPVMRAGTIAYFLNASFSPAALSHLLTDQKLPGTWRAAITDSSGSVAARTHDIEKFLAKKVTPILLEKMSLANEDAFKTQTLDGIPVITVYSRSPLSQWAVVLGMPLDEMTAGLRRTLWQLIAATFAALGLALALAMFIGGRIATSITALTGPAKAIGSGAPITLPRLHIKEAIEVGNALQKAASDLHAAKHASHHDDLTGMPNRALFRVVVDQQLALCKRNETALAILFIDLDGFKAVNDTHGHAAGDELLRMVSLRIKESVRESDFSARLGGDEFVVALIHSSLENAKTIAEKLIAALSIPYPVAEVVAHVSASIGIATYPASATDFDTLLIHADRAMYAAKAKGKRCFSVSA